MYKMFFRVVLIAVLSISGLNDSGANAFAEYYKQEIEFISLESFEVRAEGNNVILEYVSDGMEGGDDSLISVNKLFEKYVYAYIEYEILNSKLGVQEYIVRRAQKNKTALFRNAKLRLSNIHPGRLLQNMRGRDKWIK